MDKECATCKRNHLPKPNAWCHDCIDLDEWEPKMRRRTRTEKMEICLYYLTKPVSLKDTADKFGCSITSIYIWKEKYK